MINDSANRHCNTPGAYRVIHGYYIDGVIAPYNCKLIKALLLV